MVRTRTRIGSSILLFAALTFQGCSSASSPPVAPAAPGTQLSLAEKNAASRASALPALDAGPVTYQFFSKPEATFDECHSTCAPQNEFALQVTNGQIAYAETITLTVAPTTAATALLEEWDDTPLKAYEEQGGLGTQGCTGGYFVSAITDPSGNAIPGTTWTKTIVSSSATATLDGYTGSDTLVNSFYYADAAAGTYTFTIRPSAHCPSDVGNPLQPDFKDVSEPPAQLILSQQ